MVAATGHDADQTQADRIDRLAGQSIRGADVYLAVLGGDRVNKDFDRIAVQFRQQYRRVGTAVWLRSWDGW